MALQLYILNAIDIKSTLDTCKPSPVCTMQTATDFDSPCPCWTQDTGGTSRVIARRGSRHPLVSRLTLPTLALEKCIIFWSIQVQLWGRLGPKIEFPPWF